MRTPLTLLLLAALALAAPPASAAQRTLKAGAAAGDITPPIGTPMFAYTARSRIAGPDNNADILQVLADPDQHLYAKTFVGSKGIHMRLKARSLVIEREGVAYALTQVDLGGIPYALAQAVAERVAHLGITQDRLLISATHTHSAHGAIWPNYDNLGYASLGGDLFDRRAWDVTVAGIAESIEKAHERRVPVRIGIGSAEVRDASRNRASEPFARNEDGPADPIDPLVSVVRVDAAKGRDKPIAVWSNFAIHATSFGDGNLLFSGDNPGYTERIVERATGAVNVWTNGNEGDISPNGGPEKIDGEDRQWVRSSFGSAHLAGARVAAGVLAAWRDAGEDMRGDVEIDARQAYLAFDGTRAEGEPVGPLPVLGGGGIVLPDAQCAPVENMAGPGQGWKFPLFGAPRIVPDVAPVSVWRIGGLGIAALPSEVTKQMGTRIRAAVQQASGGALGNVVLAGLTDGYLSYTATPEEYDACQYEGSFTLFGRRQGPRYRDFTATLAASLLADGASPAGAAEPLMPPLDPALPTRPRATSDPGRVVSQPEDVERFGRAAFSWQGGDRSVDAPRGRTWVRLQRQTAKGWKTVATESSFRNAVRRDAGDVYVVTHQFGACAKLGDYRFRVTGRAYDGSTARDYEATSKTFRLGSLTLQADAPVVSGGSVSVRARYPDPGQDALTFLPRLVETGYAELLVDGEPVTAEPEAGSFRATVPAGAAVSLVRVEDACGNTTG